MSLVMRKPFFRICENKDADQLRDNPEADLCLCFRYKASTIPLLPKYKISSLLPSSVTAQPGKCQARSETPKTSFLRTRLTLWHMSQMKIQICLSPVVRKPGFLTKSNTNWAVQTQKMARDLKF